MMTRILVIFKLSFILSFEITTINEADNFTLEITHIYHVISKAKPVAVIKVQSTHLELLGPPKMLIMKKKQAEKGRVLFKYKIRTYFQ